MFPGRTAPALAALLLVSCTPKKTEPPQISISGAWSRATVAGQASAAAYLTIVNRGGDDKLLKVSTPIGQATLHSTTMDNGVMRMRPLDMLPVPAGSQVELKPGGMHIMIMGVKQPLVAESSFPLTLQFDRSGERGVTVAVRPATSTGGGM
jgi:copper(I)-binding protein